MESLYFIIYNKNTSIYFVSLLLSNKGILGHELFFNIGCGPPKLIDNTTLLGNVFTVQAKLKYICKDNLQMTKDSQSQIFCQTDGTWNISKVRCVGKAEFIFAGLLKRFRLTDLQCLTVNMSVCLSVNILAKIKYQQ